MDILPIVITAVSVSILWLAYLKFFKNDGSSQNQSELKVIYRSQPKSDKKVILFADTFNINFEVKNVLYAIRILNKFGYQAIIPSFDNDNLDRPLCCGRTYIS